MCRGTQKVSDSKPSTQNFVSYGALSSLEGHLSMDSCLPNKGSLDVRVILFYKSAYR